MSKTKKIVISVILVGILVFVVIPPHVMTRLFASKPTDIGEVQSVEIQLWAPLDGKSKTLYEGSFANTEQLSALKQLFMEEGLSHSDHKCASLGHFKFVTSEGIKTIEILPGHDEDYYEFRYDKKAYRIDRGKYISALKKLSIPEKAIVLDGHPGPE